jgi:hypothetical protein
MEVAIVSFKRSNVLTSTPWLLEGDKHLTSPEAHGSVTPEFRPRLLVGWREEGSKEL